MADFDPNFLIHPQTRDLNLLRGKKAVFQVFKTLVLSGIEDFIMRSDIHGGNIYQTLFDNDNALLRAQMTSKIEEIARIDEPRIVIKAIDFDGSKHHHLIIKIKYLYENELEMSEDSIKIVRTS